MNPNDSVDLQKLEKYRFNPEKPIPKPIPFLSLKGVDICTPGNISNIQGQAKSAKSSVMGGAIAAMLRALTGKPADDLSETLGFTSALPANPSDQGQKIILHFDTEQSTYHHHKLATDILKRAAIQQEQYPRLPFFSYSLVCIDLEDRRKMIDAKIQQLEADEYSLACLVLDGVADLIGDPNEGRESNVAVSWLHGLADRKHCVVLTILHENPGDASKGTRGKARGHLGSQIQRKSETNLCVHKKDGDAKRKSVTKIWTERSRGKAIEESNAVEISWNESKQRHTLHETSPSDKGLPSGESPKPSSLTRVEQRAKDWLEKTALKQPKIFSELVSLVMANQKVENRTAKSRIKKWTQRGWIHKTEDGKTAPYSLGPAPVEIALPTEALPSLNE